MALDEDAEVRTGASPNARAKANTSSPSRSKLTPQQIERAEISRAQAMALRAEREKALQSSIEQDILTPGRKRTAAPNIPVNQRDARRPRTDGTANGVNGEITSRPLEEIRPARKFTKYVDYDFSKMTDTKGGFLTVEDDPHNKALHFKRDSEKPTNMTQKEWEWVQQQQAMRVNRSDPFGYGPAYLKSAEAVKCRECQSTDVDWKWYDTFKVAVCNPCKDKFPEKYSLLTKTEAREDYLLTEPELKDEELLPHLERPNPHKSTWNNMMLFLRCQVEEYAFSSKKWGSPEALDEEFARREALRKKQKESKFKTRLQELKKRTLVESSRRARQRAKEGGGGEAKFGDVVTPLGRHVHTWGRAVMNEETGMSLKTCVECGMEVEELEF
ncbi:hypothetical protein KEM54_006710 [Ascosphaera aggregata]|nr:hypothetical protein KEM54_006710 [Ascosphaera aggregata]